MKVVFKKATIKDVAGIIDLCNECFGENTNLEYALKMFEKTSEDINNIYLIGLVDDQIIAHAKITIIPTMYEKMNIYSILNHVCVKPSFRRHGIATKMLNEISSICLTYNCKTMELWSNNVRTAAHSFYKRFGFHLDEAGFFSKELK